MYMETIYLDLMLTDSSCCKGGWDISKKDIMPKQPSC